MDQAKQDRLIALLKEKGMWPKEDGRLIFSDEYEDHEEGRKFSYYGSFDKAAIIAAVDEMKICDLVSIPGGGNSYLKVKAVKAADGEMLEICFQDSCYANITGYYTLLYCKLSDVLG